MFTITPLQSRPTRNLIPKRIYKYSHGVPQLTLNESSIVKSMQMLPYYTSVSVPNLATYNWFNAISYCQTYSTNQRAD